MPGNEKAIASRRKQPRAKKGHPSHSSRRNYRGRSCGLRSISRRSCRRPGGASLPTQDPSGTAGPLRRLGGPSLDASILLLRTAGRAAARPGAGPPAIPHGRTSPRRVVLPMARRANPGVPLLRPPETAIHFLFRCPHYEGARGKEMLSAGDNPIGRWQFIVPAVVQGRAGRFSSEKRAVPSHPVTSATLNPSQQCDVHTHVTIISCNAGRTGGLPVRPAYSSSLPKTQECNKALAVTAASEPKRPSRISFLLLAPDSLLSQKTQNPHKKTVSVSRAEPESSNYIVF